MYGTSIGSVIGTQVGFLIALLICTVCSFKFAATAATIVSGAIAERTKFTTYLIFFIDDFTYLSISGSWVWNAGGWLAKMGFTDFAVQV
jgi:Amt family ammonium transporter